MDGFCFLGEWDVRIDKHNRLTLPISFREGLSDKFYLTMGLNIQCIWVMPEEVFRKMLQKLRSSIDNFDVSGQLWISQITSGTVERKLDKSNRFSIPINLKNYAQIGDMVKIVGHDNRLEIWSLEKWKNIVMDSFEFTDCSEKLMKKYDINL
jgi:MraZ protein